jgi:hypothetical protein
LLSWFLFPLGNLLVSCLTWFFVPRLNGTMSIVIDTLNMLFVACYVHE